MERALLKALGGLGLDAERLHRAYKDTLATWYCVLGRLAVLLDMGAWTVRELRANQDAEVKASLYWVNSYFDPDLAPVMKGLGTLPRGPALTQHDGGFWASTLGPYEERWQAVGVGWAYDMVPWPWPEEVADSLDWRGFRRRSA